jgi:DnaJ family protein C protein 2
VPDNVSFTFMLTLLQQQDHYAVLGLSKHRFRATEEQIKRAHRKKVLKHHPDKKAAAGSAEDDNFFKCIQKAHDTLLDPVKRRQFDSVDENAEVAPPSKKEAKGTKFYSLWSKVFAAEGRFSAIQPVPKFGKEDSSKDEVENFYNFFYNFSSWRSFEYLDEDVPDDARKKKKVEDSTRLRELVDQAQAGDERIKRFRKEANAAKNKKKLDKEADEKKKNEDAKAAKEAEAKAAQEAEAKAKADREQGKKAKEAAKAAVKKNRRVLKSSVKEGANYFVDGTPDDKTINGVLSDVELIQGKIDPDELSALAGKLNGLKIAGEIKTVWTDEVARLTSAGKLKEGDIKMLV